MRIYVRGLAPLILPRHQPRGGTWVLATPQHDAVHLARNAHTHDPGPETLWYRSQGSTQGLQEQTHGRERTKWVLSGWGRAVGAIL